MSLRSGLRRGLRRDLRPGLRRDLRWGLRPGLGLLLGLLLGACRVENLDHCVHRAADADAWCSVQHSGTPYCSPCEADNNGCVAEAPSVDACPLLSEAQATTPTSASTSSSSSSSSAAGASSTTG